MRRRSRAPERVSVVRTIDDLQRVAVIRAIVYVDGQDCPYDEEFDGNDLCGLHLLGWVGAEPAASLRMRFFGGFAKLERLAVRPEHRRSSIAYRWCATRCGSRGARGSRGPTAMRGRGSSRSGPGSARGLWAGRAHSPFSGRRYTEMVLDLKRRRTPSDSAAIRSS